MVLIVVKALRALTHMGEIALKASKLQKDWRKLILYPFVTIIFEGQR